jgi:hypothetical protein
MTNTQPNTHLVRDALLRGETVAGAKLELNFGFRA